MPEQKKEKNSEKFWTMITAITGLVTATIGLFATADKITPEIWGVTFVAAVTAVINYARGRNNKKVAEIQAGKKDAS